MSLHRLASVTIGVPNLEQTRAYYSEFGLSPLDDGWFGTRDGGSQLRLIHSPQRRLVDLTIGADHPDDLQRTLRQLERMGIAAEHDADSVTTIEPVGGSRVVVRVDERVEQISVAPTPYNGPGRLERTGTRAPGILREDPVRPRKLGHVVLGSTDYERTRQFFSDGLGFKTSDHIKGHGSFLRCSTDHHNILVLAAPVNFLHHTSWQVNDVDDVGRGAATLLERDPARHVWGLGRHHAGSNFFWYLKDPAGNFSEYYSDMDCIPEDAIWKPEDFEGAQGLFAWGPPPPPSFLHPEDLAALMTGAHHQA
jgi:catechol 2,3-dioxygenase-like lactoylglutathione lyase family enzyme